MPRPAPRRGAGCPDSPRASPLHLEGLRQSSNQACSPPAAGGLGPGLGAATYCSTGVGAATVADDTGNRGKASQGVERQADEEGAQDEVEECIVDPAADLLDKFDVRLNLQQDELLVSFGKLLDDVKDAIITKIEGQEQQLSSHHQRLSSDWGQQLKLTHDGISEKLSTLNRFPRLPGLPAGTGSTDQANSDTGDDTPTRPTLPQMLDVDGHDETLRKSANNVAIQEQVRFQASREFSGKELSRLEVLVNSQGLELIILATIVTNAVFIGIQTELATRKDGTEDHIAIFAVGLLYTLVFTAELLLRICAKGWRRFLSCAESQWQWNYLDAVIVIFSLLEAAMDIMVRSTAGEERRALQDSSQFRLIRMVRLTRLSRGLRITRLVSVIGALRALVHQIAHTVKSMCWAMLLLLLILYLFAIIFTQGTTMYLVELGDDLDHLEPAHPLLQYWSTLPRSMFTLFKSITGGISWEEVVLPLSTVDSMWVLLFVMYVCWTQLTVLNVITGFFCQNAIESAQLDQDLVTQQTLARNKMFREQLRALFQDLDADSSGTITIQELTEHLESDVTRAYFDSLGIDASDVWTLFKLMDLDQNSYILIEEFVNGVMRLKGDAKSLDMAKLTYEHKFLSNQLARFVHRTDRALSHITGGVFHSSQSRKEGFNSSESDDQP